MNSASENSSIGYILEADLEYPSELHNLHNDYPSAPEKLEISQDMLLTYCFNIANEYGLKIGGFNKVVPSLDNTSKYKLVPSLGNTSKFVAHYRNLQLYLSLRMKMTKFIES